jgi:hypothetical protein
VTGDAVRTSFEYFVLRCVPRVDREEFVNVGVVVYCQGPGFLAAACDVKADRLRALNPDVDVDAVCAALATIEAVCRGDDSAGPAAGGSRRERFGWLAAPRSTVVQPGPIHAGLSDDPARELAHLLAILVA